MSDVVIRDFPWAGPADYPSVEFTDPVSPPASYAWIAPGDVQFSGYLPYNGSVSQLWNGTMPDADQWAELVYQGASGNGGYFNLCIRAAYDAPNFLETGYEAFIYSSPNAGFMAFAVVQSGVPAGVQVTLTPGNVALSAITPGDVFRLEAIGGTINFYQNGVLLWSGSDSTWTAAGSIFYAVGLNGVPLGSLDLGEVKFGTFGSTLPTGGGFIPPGPPPAGGGGGTGGGGGSYGDGIGHAVNANAYAISVNDGAKVAPGTGELIGDLEPLRNWCRANGISVSLCQDSQRTAKDLLDELLTVGNSAPVYSGDTLKVIPYDEVSAAGNGAAYTAPTSGGPVANLTDQDFVFDGKNPPVRFTRKRRADCDNVVSIEHIDRDLQYAHRVTTECDQVAVAQHGPRKGGTLDAAQLGVNPPSGSKALLSIHSTAVAQKIASVLAKRNAAGANAFEFSLKAEWLALEAMDLVTITDARLGLNALPVRLISTKETAQRTLDCVAEEFLYGLNHPDVSGITAATGTLVAGNVDPGLVNAPVILQPTAGLLGSGNGPELWFVVSGADPNYGGCVAFLSLDGGASYPITVGVVAPGVTGDLTATFADHADPDTVDTLAVDLSESGGSLSSQSTDVADAFADPAYVGGVDVYTYEVVCYTTVALTSAEHYNLTAYIRRGALGTAHASHASGKRFALLDASVLKIALSNAWIGKALYFKFAAFNKVGGQQNQLSDCVAYTYTPTATNFLPGGFYINGS